MEHQLNVSENQKQNKAFDMGQEQFKTIVSTFVPLPIDNVDTDQIIPARFLKATERKGFGDNLFRDWRYTKDNQPKDSFILNNPIYRSCFGGRKKLWQRFQPRTCCLGHLRLWVQGGGIELFCRYFQKQCVEQ
jgi:hypothetical protein